MKYYTVFVIMSGSLELFELKGNLNPEARRALLSSLDDKYWEVKDLNYDHQVTFRGMNVFGFEAELQGEGQWLESMEGWDKVSEICW